MGFFDKPIVADETQANSGGDYTPIPEGVYNLLIEKSELVKSKANNDMIKLTFVVEDGDFENRKLFTNLNIAHANPQVVEIAKKQLHALLILCGLKQIEDAADLMGQSLKTKVKVKKRTDTGEMQNEVVLSLPGKDDKKADTPKPTTTARPKW